MSCAWTFASAHIDERRDATSLFIFTSSWTFASAHIDERRDATSLFIFTSERQFGVSKQRRLDDVLMSIKYAPYRYVSLLVFRRVCLHAALKHFAGAMRTLQEISF
jgi:hypothetical protein